MCIKCLLLCARIYLTSILLFMCMCLAFFCVFVCRTGLTWSLRCLHRRNMKMKCTYSCILPHYTMPAPVLSKFNSLNYSVMLYVVYFNCPMKKAISWVNGSQWLSCHLMYVFSPKAASVRPTAKKKFFQGSAPVYRQGYVLQMRTPHPPT